MRKFIPYPCVSTDRQDESGLGLEAQRAAVARFKSGRRYTNLQPLAAALD